MKKFLTLFLAVAGLMVSAAAGQALTAKKFKAHGIFSSHMVLQADRPIVISGTAEPESTLLVSFAGKQLSATAGKNGEWQAEFPALQAGNKAYTMEISGDAAAKKIKFNDILIGEVWFCSGQSNMTLWMKRIANSNEEIKNADYPFIRIWQEPKHVSPFIELTEPAGKSWQVCTPKTIVPFSAVAYCFGRELYKKLQVPVGLIHASWGGTRIQPWISPDAIAANESCKPENEQREKHYQELMKKPEFQQQPDKYNFEKKKYRQFPGSLYNSMTAPWTRIAIRGVIWYQGCANAGNPRYYGWHRTLIQDWRNKFRNPDMPFVLVQLAGFSRGAVKNRPPEDTWMHQAPEKCPRYALTREIQAALLSDPKVGMAVAMDVGDQFDIHPANKQTVGKRLCAEALRTAYGRTEISQGPKFRKFEINGDQVRVYFDNVGSGLTTKDGKAPGAFALKNANGKLVWAQARIDGDTVVVSSPEVKKPAAVRYAFCGYRGDVNLMNKEGFAAIPFRSDAPKY